MGRERIAVLIVVAFALFCVFSGVAFAEPSGNGANPTMNADNPQGVWQSVKERMSEMDGLSNTELIALIGQGGQDALLATSELISRGADAVPDILAALKDPETQNLGLLAGALAKIAKNDPALQKQVIGALAEIANDPNNQYSAEQQMAAANAMIAMGGKAAYQMLSKDMKLEVAKAMLQKANDIHSTWYWHNKPGNFYEPWPNR